MSSTTVEVYTSTQVVDVHIVKTRLESEGIECFVTGETLNQVFGGVQGITQGVSLMVRESDAETALHILRDEGYIPECDGHDPITTVGKKHTDLNKQIWTLIGLILLVLMALAIYTYLVS